MTERISLADPQALIISSNTTYANTVRLQLLNTNHECLISEPKELGNIARLREINPTVVLIDHSATTSEGLPGHEFLRNALPDCEVILIVPLEATEAAASLARKREVFDYVVADFADDTQRIPLLVERASARGLSSLSETRGQAKTEHQQILDEFSTLRGILKSRNEGPVVELLHRHHMNEVPAAFDDDASEGVAAHAYHNSLIDLICGRIKRLERLVQMNKSTPDNARTPQDRILIVEDAPVDAEIAIFALEKHGYDVVWADSAAAAKQALDTESPDLVLMDIHLGDANGLKLVSAMRRNEMRRHIPVIIISCDTRKEAVSTARALDVQGFFRKPYDPTLLAEKVKQVLAETFSSRSTSREDT